MNSKLEVSTHIIELVVNRRQLVWSPEWNLHVALVALTCCALAFFLQGADAMDISSCAGHGVGCAAVAAELCDEIMRRSQ